MTGPRIKPLPSGRPPGYRTIPNKLKGVRESYGRMVRSRDLFPAKPIVGPDGLLRSHDNAKEYYRAFGRPAQFRRRKTD